MKKIGILTFHQANNYGAVLQNYALQKCIGELGYQVETINYIIPRIKKEYKVRKFILKKNLKNCIKVNFWNILNYKNAKIQFEKYESFRNTYLNISVEEVHKNTIADTAYDVYITGSDQVWNKGIVGLDDMKTYTLAFSDTKKASYAASCGDINMLADVEDIKKIDYVTVREYDLSQELYNCNIENKVVCDPTILLGKSEWTKLIEDTPIDHENYVYLYYIDSGKNEAAKIAKAIANEKNLKVYYSKKLDKDAIKNKYGVNKLSDGPLDFIKEISNADTVVVSSFHGVVFSILMEKDFVALLHEKTGDRVISLLNKIGLMDRVVKNFDDYKNREFKPIDYDNVNSILEEWRKESLEELRKICEL